MRCPNGSRKNKQGNCVSNKLRLRKRCPNGSRKNKQGNCTKKFVKKLGKTPELK
jgi:hypothetical protein